MREFASLLHNGEFARCSSTMDLVYPPTFPEPPNFSNPEGGGDAVGGCGGEGDSLMIALVSPKARCVSRQPS